jgi:hypothetical protein
MSEPEPHAAVSPPSRRVERWLRCIFAIAIASIIVVGVLVKLFVDKPVVRVDELREAIAEADRLDPEWRHPELEVQRRKIPDDENGALRVQAAAGLLPKKWPKWEGIHPRKPDENVEDARHEFEGRISYPPTETQLDDQQIEALKAELLAARAALTEARRLADCPDGRYSIPHEIYRPGILNPFLVNARTITNLLGYDALLQAQRGRIDRALASCRAMVAVGRSFGPEPGMVYAMTRILVSSVSVFKIERVLAQGEPSEAALSQVQAVLEKEEAEPLSVYAIRGERAECDRVFEAFPKETNVLRSWKEQFGMFLDEEERGKLARNYVSLNIPSVLKEERAALLRFMNRWLEIAKRPVEERGPQMDELVSSLERKSLFVRHFFTLGQFEKGCHRSHASLRCAIALVAIERYRLANKSWPTSLKALVPKYLNKVPTDPFDGVSLKYAKRKEGVVVYSVGEDGVDNGGNVRSPFPVVREADFGFRLWDVAKRRQPPRSFPRVNNE